jgi:DNA-binding MarR family transcriptional regulator
MIDAKQIPQKLTLGHLLVRLSRLVGGRMRMKLEGLGLHHAQGMILSQLWQQEGMAQNVLARVLYIRPPTMTNTLQRMERGGWIERRRDIADQRIVRVYLTGKAKALRSETRASFLELDKELASVLTAGEHDLLMTSLSKVHHHLSSTLAASDRFCSRHEKPHHGGKENR